MQYALVNLLLNIIHIYELIIIVWIVLSLLIHFKIVNAYQPFIQKVNYFLFAITEPVLKPIRKFIPSVGGIDLSPMVLILMLYFIQDLLVGFLR